MSSPDESLDLGATLRGFVIGQKVFNRYVLKKILGRGGMGVVWLAQDEELEQEVALKFLPEIVMSDRSALDDLRRETRRSREMTHPHIVRIHDFLRDDRTAAISMEYVAGDTLSNRKADQPTKFFNVAQIRPWIEQLCAALHYAHTKAQVVHRDLKPTNLMLDARGDLKITDFGIARSISDSVSRVSAQASSSGTPVYMSPQQMMGEMPRASDDIYAFGATVYELLTSRPPFYSGNVLVQLKDKIPPSMTERRAEFQLTGEPIPEAWEKTIAHCLAKEEDQRPKSMAEVAALLGLSAGDYATAATAATGAPPAIPAAPAKSATPPAKLPLPLILGGVAAVLLVVGIFAGRGWWNSRQAAQADARAQAALTAGDWKGAFAAVKEAMTRKPDAAAYRERHEAVQRGWIQHMQDSVKTGGEGAFALMSDTPAEITSQLGEAAAAQYQKLRSDAQAAYRQQLRVATEEAVALAAQGKFGEAESRLTRLKSGSALLPAEYAAGETLLRESRQRSDIQAALAQAAGGDTAGASAKLKEMTAQGALADELTLARKRVQTLAEVTLVERIARAVAAGDAGTAQSAINDYTKLSGQAVQVTAAQLLAEQDFGKFLRLLEQLRIRPAAEAQRQNRFDLVVVESLRGRFGQNDAARQFINQSYAGWAREELSRGRLGSAWYLCQRALAAGATPADGVLERQITEELVRKLDLNLALPLTEIPRGAAGGLQTVARDALRARLAQATDGFMRTGDIPDPRKPSTIVVQTRLAPLERKGTTKSETRVAQYQAGTKEVPNPRRAELEQAVAKGREQAKATQTIKGVATGLAGLIGARAAKSGDAGTGLVTSLVVAGAADAAGKQTSMTLQQAEQELAKTPAVLIEPVMAEQAYEAIVHQLTYTATLTVETAWSGRVFGQPLQVQAVSSHTTDEIKGDARKGVPVKALAEPDAGTLGNAIGAELARQLEAVAPQLLHSVGSASLLALEFQLAAAKAAALSADLRWGLLHFWRKAGVQLPDPVNTERALRLELGLPLGEPAVR